MHDPFDATAPVFLRGLNNLKTLLAKAEAHCMALHGDPAALLLSRLLRSAEQSEAVAYVPRDVHAYTLADQVHWAAEGARLAIERIRGEEPVPSPSGARSFAELGDQIDRTIAVLRTVPRSALEAGLVRQIRINLPRGSVECTGSQFLLAYAIPHFYYHLSSVYGILRNEGIPLTMGDFLGDWGSN